MFSLFKCKIHDTLPNNWEETQQNWEKGFIALAILLIVCKNDATKKEQLQVLRPLQREDWNYFDKYDPRILKVRQHRVMVGYLLHQVLSKSKHLSAKKVTRNHLQIIENWDVSMPMDNLRCLNVKSICQNLHIRNQTHSISSKQTCIAIFPSHRSAHSAVV